MSALPAEKPPTPSSSRRWREVVDAVDARVTDEVSLVARMPCPVHNGTKNNFVLSAASESDYPLLHCHSGCDVDDPAWRRAAVAALVTAGAPESALRPVRSPTRSQDAQRPEQLKELGLPDDEAVEAWVACLGRERIVLQALRKAWGISDPTLARAEVGWEPFRELVALPVRDVATGDVVQVIYRDLRDKRPEGAPKSQTHPGIKGSHIYAPGGLGDGGPVLLCAGEKDVLCAMEAGFVNVASFTNGEKALPPPDRLRPLAGREVVVIYDNDEAGRTGALRVANGLAGVAESIAVADLASVAGLGIAGDVADVLAKADGVSLLRRVISDAKVLIAQDDPLPEIKAALTLAAADEPDHYDRLLTDADLAHLDPISHAVEGWAPRGGYTTFYGPPGVGKTLLLLDLARSIAAGIPWHTYGTTDGPVLMYQGEGLAQLRSRTEAWNAANDLPPDAILPVRYTNEIVDLTKPEGLAAVVRTVRLVAEDERQPVRAVIFDPLVEFMSGDENGDGMRDVSLGLRVLAQVLDCAVIIGHHTNASGQRERGAAFLKMRAQAFVRMERLSGGGVGVVQEKQRNGERLALRLDMKPEEDSVVLETAAVLSAEDYEASRDEAKAAVSERRARRSDKAEDLLLAAIHEQPGIAKDRLIKACKGHGVGATPLVGALADLAQRGVVKVETDPSDGRETQRHYLAATPPHPSGRGPD